MTSHAENAQIQKGIFPLQNHKGEISRNSVSIVVFWQDMEKVIAGQRMLVQ